MAVTIRLNLEKDTVEIGNEDIGFAKFEGNSRDIAWGRKFAEYLEEEGIDVDLEESDDDEEERPRRRR